jgi:hypothetical protein
VKSTRCLAACAAWTLSLCLTPAFAHAQDADANVFDTADTPMDPAGDIVDIIFGSGMEETNGAASCATATRLANATTNVADTTNSPDWVLSVGPIPTPAHDVVYSFVPGPASMGSFMPIASNYPFAMFLIPSCAENGREPTPLAATSQIGQGIDIGAVGLVTFQRYYLVVTAIASAGADASGTLRFTTPLGLAIDTGP